MDDNNFISFSDFVKADIRVGEIVKWEKVEGSNKLLKLEVYLGEECGTHTIMAGIAKHYANPQGMLCLVVVNMAPRMMMGVESRGMLLAGEDPVTKTVTLAMCGCPPGTRIG